MFSQATVQNEDLASVKVLMPYSVDIEAQEGLFLSAANGYTDILVSGRFAYGSFRLRSVRLRIESIRLRLICQFAYESDVEALNLNY